MANRRRSGQYGLRGGTAIRRRIDLIGVASGLGGADADCGRAPLRLAAAGLEAHLRTRGVEAQWRAMLTPNRARVVVPRAVAGLCTRLAMTVAESIRGGGLPCIVGGDHSCAAGTWMGAARAAQPHGDVGLVWIDAHMDAHTPGTSPSGRQHGMPLAALLGQCDNALEGLEAGVVAGRNVCLVGVRSYEPEEAALLRRLGVTVIAMDEVTARGVGPALEDAVAIASRGTAGYGVTIDVDALDPRDAPAVATPVADGIRGAELIPALAQLGCDPRLVAVELAEYCPRRDRNARTERLLTRMLLAVLCGTAEEPEIVADALEAA